jgi:RNA polymerase sigma-70 factor, ECF subfamily
LTERMPKPAPVSAPLPLELRTLFEQHYASLWRLLRRLGVDSAQLDDAAQEVFWVAARRLADIELGREHAFLYGVALRVAANQLRQQRTAFPLVEPERHADAVDQGPSPEEQLEQQRERRLLDEVLAQLPLELRTVLVLFELEGLELKQIAALQDIPVGTASSRLRRAREDFSAIARRTRARLPARIGGVQ